MFRDGCQCGYPGERIYLAKAAREDKVPVNKKIYGNYLKHAGSNTVELSRSFCFFSSTNGILNDADQLVGSRRIRSMRAENIAWRLR